MFELTAGRLQLDINSPLVNIHTGSYVENEGVYIVLNAHNSSRLCGNKCLLSYDTCMYA